MASLKASFQPHIEYCINIWTCTTRTTLEPINISMKKAIRKMIFSKMDSHIKPLFKKLNILDFQNTLDLNLGKFMWDVTRNNYPLSDTLNFVRLTSSNRKIIPTEKYIPICRTKYKENFITTTGTLLWKCIPTTLKEIKNKKIILKKVFQISVGKALKNSLLCKICLHSTVLYLLTFLCFLNIIKMDRFKSMYSTAN